MPTLIIQLDPSVLTNPDTDIRYLLPDLLISRSHGLLTDDGYDYVDNVLLLFLETEDPTQALALILSLLTTERVLDNDLSQTPIAVDDGHTLTIHHPPNFTGPFHHPPPPNPDSPS